MVSKATLPAAMPMEEALAREASALGFADFGITTPGAVVEAGARLRRAIDDAHHGEMAWMADRLDWRADPRRLWPACRSVIMLADAYTPDRDPLAAVAMREAGAISVYADGRDYHDVVKKRLKRLGRWLIEVATAKGQPAEIKVFVDTAPVMEKPLAAAAGLGWQGKHTNLVAPRGGSWFFLGAIFTTLALAPSTPGHDRCGSCRACLDICPTQAFPAPYRLDARRCISYLTIELKGVIPRALRPGIGNRIFGCDDCLAVCPWNKFAVAAHGAYRAGRGEPAPLTMLASLDDAGFRERFRGSPVKRIGRDRFLRNVAVALGNAPPEAPGIAEATRRLARDASALVRAHAIWALGRQAGRGGGALGTTGRDDPEEIVRAEWAAARGAER
ncbi:MAG: tRNA epoxyqueuosine(34) reductase QueG [Pseudomonadota bacterium]